MKNYIVVTTLLFIMLVQSCKQPEKHIAPVHINIKYPKPENKFANVIFANKKDLTCGMPLTAGVGDTAHYKGKIYGFCSKECKDAFLQDPKAYSLIR